MLIWLLQLFALLPMKGLLNSHHKHCLSEVDIAMIEVVLSVVVLSQRFLQQYSLFVHLKENDIWKT